MRMAPALAKLLSLAAIAICLVASASFGLYAINQTDTASAHQQETLADEGAGQPASAPETGIQTHEPHTKGVRGVIDEVSKTLTSPFDGVTASSNSEWTKRGANVLLALLVYGFGLGYVARFIRVRT
jgi:hypothetical protein